MEAEVKRKGGALVLAVTGDLDQKGTARVRRVLFEKGIFEDDVMSGACDMVVDLSAMTFISSSGVGMLVLLKMKFGNAGLGLVIAGAPEFLRRIFGVLRIADHFKLFSTAGEALKFFCGEACEKVDGKGDGI